MGYGALDCGFCDFVKNDTFGFIYWEAKQVANMPRNGFSFSIIICS
jgi:hypothetical protein